MKAYDVPLPVRVSVTAILAAATVAYTVWAFSPKSEEKKQEKKT